jgi:transcription elongation factor Elf1
MKVHLRCLHCNEVKVIDVKTYTEAHKLKCPICETKEAVIERIDKYAKE